MGTFNSIPCRARPLLSYWIAVSVIRLETGNCYDNDSKKRRNYTQRKWEKKISKKTKAWKKKYIYRDGLSEYVSNGCEDGSFKHCYYLLNHLFNKYKINLKQFHVLYFFFFFIRRNVNPVSTNILVMCSIYNNVFVRPLLADISMSCFSGR